AVALRPDLAVVVIGANDLARFAPPAAAAADLGAAVAGLRAAGSDVVVVPAPDLALVPWIPAVYRPVVTAACASLRSRQVAATQQHGGRAAEIADEVGAAFTADASLFSADRFHPSSAGYARIAGALAPTVLAAA